MSEQEKISKPKRAKRIKHPPETVREYLTTLLGEPVDWKLRGHLMIFMLDGNMSGVQVVERYQEVTEKAPAVWMWYEQAVGFKI